MTTGSCSTYALGLLPADSYTLVVAPSSKNTGTYTLGVKPT